MNMATVGVLARIDLSRASIVFEQLSLIEGVEIFDAGEAGQIGILVEAVSLDEAHDRITREIQAVDGVLCAWPVYVHLDEDEEVEGDQEADATLLGGPQEKMRAING